MSLEVDVRVAAGAFTVDATFEAGAGTVALLGPNGAGKSTVVGAIAGLRAPERGRIALDGRVLEDVAGAVHVPPQDRRIGVVFQDRLLFPHLSALDNVAFPLRAAGASRPDARERAGRQLARTAPGVRPDAGPADLSGGEQQRVALARALVTEPRLLLLDEPLAALDVAARTAVRRILREVVAAFEGPCVLVTHDPVDALTLAARVVVVEDGHVTQSGTPDELRRAPRSSYAAALVGTNLFRGPVEPLEPGVGRLRAADGEVLVPWTGPSADDVAALLDPVDVALHLLPPEGSPRNVIEGRVTEIVIEGTRSRVRVDGRPSLVAEITPGSVQRLGLHEGDRVWASFKTVEVRVEPL
ncbi:MAG: ABC transporter ATP-binding protein [Actinomycetota bacterium]